MTTKRTTRTTRAASSARPRPAKASKDDDNMGGVIALRLPDELKRRVEERAGDAGTTLSAVVRTLLELYASGRLEVRTVVTLDGDDK